ncbi:MAG: hypothetical protein ABFR89_02505 [Actinomycetota bacterium]
MQKQLERVGWGVKWSVEKFAKRDILDAGLDLLTPSPELKRLITPADVLEGEGNLLLNEGIAEMWLLITGGAGTAFSNANSYLAVGNSATAASASDTDLLGASKFYATMVATWPQITAQTCQWKADFTDAQANFAWAEWSVANGSSGTAENLNRKVAALGTKASGTWTLTVDITLS